MTFKVGLTRDLLTKQGTPCFDPAALEVLKLNPDIAWEWLDEDVGEITPAIAARYDGVEVAGGDRAQLERVGQGGRRGGVGLEAARELGLEVLAVALGVARRLAPER